jgi:hypothetical protein
LSNKVSKSILQAHEKAEIYRINQYAQLDRQRAPQSFPPIDDQVQRWIQAPDLSRGEKEKFFWFQAPGFIRGVNSKIQNPKSKIQNPKSNDRSNAACRQRSLVQQG